MINVGTKIDETLEILRFLGSSYSYIIVGYPPFLIHLFTEGEKQGFIWQDWHINILSGGEGFIEEWRDQMQRYLGPQAIIISAYGSTDLGLSEGMETFLSVTVRKIAHIFQTFIDDPVKAKMLADQRFPNIKSVFPKDKEHVRKFFLRLFKSDPFTDRRLPMIFQYDPTTYFNEEIVSQYGNRGAAEMLTTVFHYDTCFLV